MELSRVHKQKLSHKTYLLVVLFMQGMSIGYGIAMNFVMLANIILSINLNSVPSNWIYSLLIFVLASLFVITIVHGAAFFLFPDLKRIYCEALETALGSLGYIVFIPIPVIIGFILTIFLWSIYN